MIRAALALMTILHAAAVQAQTVPPPPVMSHPVPAILASIPTAARDAPIFPIGPIGSWELDRDTIGSCAVSRNYGSAERAETVTILASPATPMLAIYVVSNASGAEPQTGKGAVMLKPGITIVGDYSSFDVPARDQHFSVLYVDRPAVAGLAGARTLAIQADRTMTIAAGDMKAAIDTTDRCMTQLYQSWGIDPARFGPGEPAPAPPGGNPGRLFNAEDYPIAARRAGIQGRVMMLLDVAKDGVVKSCHIVTSAGPDLDAVSCEIVMKRARLAPAMDAQGKPTASLVIIPVRWTLPQ